MHWRDATDPTLRRLASYNVMACFPEADDVYDDQYDELNLCFGSTGLSMRLGVFDDEARTAYMHGACILLAWALADAMNVTDARYLVVTVDETHGWSGHVALMLDECTVIDFEGVRTVEDVLDDYRRRIGHQILTRDELIRAHVDEPYRHDPMSFVEELERLVTVDFAQRIAQKATLVKGKDMRLS